MSFEWMTGGWPPVFEVPISEMPPGSILHFDKQLLVETGILWFNIILLVLVLAKVLYKPVKKFLADRTERMQQQIQQAEQDAEQAKQLREKYQALIADIEQERDEILRQGREASMERSEEIIANARREAANIYRHSMEELRLEQESQMDDMRRAIVEISTQMAGRFVEVSIDSETQNRYIDEALGHLEETLWEN